MPRNKLHYKKEAVIMRMELEPKLLAFLEEVESHIIKSGIITFAGRLPLLTTDGDAVFPSFRGQSWDIERQADGTCVYGAAPYQWPLFYKWLTVAADSGNLGVMLRTFTEEYDDLTKLLINELRAYYLVKRDNIIEFVQLPAKEVAEVHNTDAKTKKPLPPEPAVIYCGKDESDKLNDRLMSIGRTQ